MSAKDKEKDYFYRMILKENELLKKTLKEKRITDETTEGMLSILDLQRERISSLEEENSNLEKVNEQLKEKLKETNLKINDKKYNNFDSEYYQQKCIILEGKIKDITSKFSKELIKYKSKLMERDAEIILNESIYEENLDQTEKSLNSNTSVRKKNSLDPLKKKKV